MGRYINVEPFEVVGDSHELVYRDGPNICHFKLDDIPSERVISVDDLFDAEISGPITKWYCPHCERFKKWYQVNRNPFDNTKGHCKHCGRVIVSITKDFMLYAVKSSLKYCTRNERS